MLIIEKMEQNPIPLSLQRKLYNLKLSILLKQKTPDRSVLLKTYCYLLSNEKNISSLFFKKKAIQLISKMEISELLDIYREGFIKPIKSFVFLN